MRGKRRRGSVFAAILAAISLLAALSASASAAPPATAPGWGLPSFLAHSHSAAHRLAAARLRRAERAVMRRHGHAVASPAAARPDIVASGFEGTVTDAASKEALTGIEVCAYNVELLEEGLYEEEELEPACGTVSEPSGHYRIGVPPGEYYVEFLDPSRNYIPQLYDSRSFAEQPDPVVVKAKPVTPNIDAALVQGGRIEGAVTAAEGGAPLSGILACAFDVEDAGFGCDETGGAGQYLIRGLPAGSYTVVFFVPPLPGENYLDEPLEEVPVTAGATTTGANQALPSGGEVEGTVTAASNGAPVEGVLVCAFASLTFDEEEELEECTNSAAHGRYTIERLEPGSYFVEFFGLPVYATQFYSGATYGAPLLADALALNVVPPSPRTGIDGVMLRVGEEPPKPAPIVTPQQQQQNGDARRAGSHHLRPFDESRRALAHRRRAGPRHRPSRERQAALPGRSLQGHDPAHDHRGQTSAFPRPHLHPARDPDRGQRQLLAGAGRLGRCDDPPHLAGGPAARLGGAARAGGQAEAGPSRRQDHGARGRRPLGVRARLALPELQGAQSPRLDDPLSRQLARGPARLTAFD